MADDQDDIKPHVWSSFAERYKVEDPKVSMPGSFREPAKGKPPRWKTNPKRQVTRPASSAAVQYANSVRRPQRRKAEIKYVLPKCDDCGKTIEHHKFCATKTVSLKPKKVIKWIWD